MAAEQLLQVEGEVSKGRCGAMPPLAVPCSSITLSIARPVQDRSDAWALVSPPGRVGAAGDSPIPPAPALPATGDWARLEEAVGKGGGAARRTSPRHSPA